MAALVDTNVLVYRYDPRFPAKQRIATDLLRDGMSSGDIHVPHQALMEFVSATTRQRHDDQGLMSLEEAFREVEEFLAEFNILYPNEDVIRLAVRGAATYRLPWFDAHIWAYAEQYGLDTLISEDFQGDRLYGSVRIVNPFD